MDVKWTEQWDNVMGLAYWLDEAGYFNRPGEVIYYFSKPWKWTNEFRAKCGGMTTEQFAERGYKAE